MFLGLNTNTKLGIISALKSVGSYLASFTVVGIMTDPIQFSYAVLIFVLINVPSDLFLLKVVSDNSKKDTMAKLVKSA